MDVISSNPFDLLGDDEGGDSPVVKPTAAAKKDQKAPPPKKETNVRSDKKPAERAPRNEYPRRGGARGGAVEGAPRTPRAPRETGDFEQAPREDRVDGERRERNTFRGGRGGRGRGGFRGREFDRHSATGRTDGVKKEVAGKGSWGNPLTAEEEAKKEISDAEGAVEKTNGDAEATETPAVEAEEVKEPEDNFKTLEQYIAERARPTNDKNVRKANEGADDAQWKDAVVLKKEEDEELFADLLKVKKSKAAAAKEKAQKTFVNIDQRFTDEGRGGFSERGRGGRGGARGGRGGDRGAPRGGRGRNAGGAVSIEDQTAFPSLGGK
ncbi:hypothetical protein PhCBS80983_g03209 [Powellomyces hirtus]|uniref:Hyaluronan/mRNA-binding protein domain-containing protein n=1 Tax=Powellomyces hirtus TaxID=109895 RepID=A0A507E2I2_9FUNG|nr:hypothetical protein DFJ77DRAFT_468673 [Powellomyces hirtus]TPX58289.1 hypothetical protein PhCBS80983_g03209 [Powellomyces hirtus]